LSARYHCQLALKQENALSFLIREMLSYPNCRIHGITWVDFNVLVTEQALSRQKIRPELYPAQYPPSSRSRQQVIKKYGQEIGCLSCSFLAEPTHTQLLVILFRLCCLDPQVKGENSHLRAFINERGNDVVRKPRADSSPPLAEGKGLCTPLRLSQKVC